METSGEPNVSKPWNYESTVDNIESIVSRIESGELPLDEVFEQFATAMEQLNQCETFLNEKQKQFELSIETLDRE
ncbi:MAG: exodeoxyribonuclease VII small subunit [Cyanobacteria bacterium SID2]|nr:exodeoxyribonuclease VII small subunit [Cyanobacteria bacterium SID2]